jgi:hypothetical protein
MYRYIVDVAGMFSKKKSQLMFDVQLLIAVILLFLVTYAENGIWVANSFG